MRRQQSLMSKMSTQLEDLRKQARHLENEVDLKLVSFSNLGTNYSCHNDGDSDTSPLLNRSASGHMFDTMSLEIEELLSKLASMNDSMMEYTRNVDSDSSSTLLPHALQRHRDILKDFNVEFQKIQTSISALLNRENLLGSVPREINSYKNTAGLNRRTELYLKENDHIRSSERLVDDQISIAIATKENLSIQNKLMKAITQKANSLTNSFPAINSLVRRVSLRQRQNYIILGCVIAVCIISLILYTFR